MCEIYRLSYLVVGMYILTITCIEKSQAQQMCSEERELSCDEASGVNVENYSFLSLTSMIGKTLSELYPDGREGRWYHDQGDDFFVVPSAKMNGAGEIAYMLDANENIKQITWGFSENYQVSNRDGRRISEIGDKSEAESACATDKSEEVYHALVGETLPFSPPPAINCYWDNVDDHPLRRLCRSYPNTFSCDIRARVCESEKTLAYNGASIDFYYYASFLKARRFGDGQLDENERTYCQSSVRIR